MRSAYVWCPAYPLHTAVQLAIARERTRALAERCGLAVEESPLLRRLAPPGAWFDAAERCADLRAGLERDVLLAARGGYGCVDLLETLGQAVRLPVLVGFSDLTVLHCWWRRRGQERSDQPAWVAERGSAGAAQPAGLALPPASVYGFMPGVPAGPRALASAAALLNGEPLAIDAASCPAAAVLRTGEASGPLVPACLRVLAALVGTPGMPSLTGSILALEDVDERPYQMERDLAQLWAGGCLAGVAGLVLGAFPSATPPGYGGPSACDVLARWADRLGVPAVAGLPFGHDPDPLALPCSRAVILRAEQGSWSLATL